MTEAIRRFPRSDGLGTTSARRYPVPCRHERPEPVDLCTGERVAMVCADCLARLPADWSGEVDEIRTFGGGVVAYIPR